MSAGGPYRVFQDNGITHLSLLLPAQTISKDEYTTNIKKLRLLGTKIDPMEKKLGVGKGKIKDLF